MAASNRVIRDAKTGQVKGSLPGDPVTPAVRIPATLPPHPAAPPVDYDRVAVQDRVQRALRELTAVNHEPCHSPDYDHHHDGNMVMVYGSLRHGNHNHGLLADATYVGGAVLPGYRMAASPYYFPYVAPSEDTNDLVVGELYVTDDRNVDDLDALEGYRGPGQRNHYDRREVTVITEHGPQTVTTYLAADDIDLNQLPAVPDGDWNTGLVALDAVERDRYGRFTDDDSTTDGGGGDSNAVTIEPTERVMFCYDCGEEMGITDDGVAHHVSPNTWEGIDYDADADHVPYPDDGTVIPHEGWNDDTW